MFLEEIIKLKKKRLEIAKSKRDFDKLKESAISIRNATESHRLQKVLKKDQINIIAEIKRASPSKGVINDNINIKEVAEAYEKGGACAISVLTEEDRFQGSLEDLKMVRAKTSLPILRKDFIFDDFQIYEAAEAGADVILLIVAMLADETLEHLYLLAEKELGLDVLVEIHTSEELKRAVKLGSKIIGINNRNLKTFEVSLDVSRVLIKEAPKNTLMVAESGLRNREYLIELRKLGFSGFLIGETLMRSGKTEEMLKTLI